MYHLTEESIGGTWDLRSHGSLGAQVLVGRKLYVDDLSFVSRCPCSVRARCQILVCWKATIADLHAEVYGIYRH